MKAQQIQQKKMKKLQEKMNEIKEECGDDKQKLMEKQAELYKKEGFNPAAGCMPALLSMPIFIAMYWVFRFDESSSVFSLVNDHLEVQRQALYSFSTFDASQSISKYFFNLIDLTKPNFYLAALTGVIQYFQFKLSAALGQKKKDEEKKKKEKEALAKKEDKDKNKEPNIQDAMGDQMKMMQYFFPAMIFFICLKLPAGMPIYWSVSSLFSIVQQKMLKK